MNDIVLPQFDASTTSYEYGFSIFKAILGEIPLWGAFTTLLESIIPNAKEERLKNYLMELWTYLRANEENIKEAYVMNENFWYIFEQAYKQILETNKRFKIHCIKGIVINSLIKEVSREEKEYYIGLINNLSELHLRILSLFNNPSHYLDIYWLGTEACRNYSFSQILSYAIPWVNADIILSALWDIHQIWLINTGKESINIMTASTWAALVEGRVTNLGKRFIEFCDSY